MLAVGLPIQWITAQKESFRKYLMINEMIELLASGDFDREVSGETNQ